MPPKKSQQNTAQQPTLSSFFKSSPIKRSNPTPASKPTETINLSDDSDGEPAAKKAKFNGSGSGGKSKGKGKETEKEGGSESEDLPEALGYDPPAKEKKDVKVSEFAASFYANPSTTTKVPTTSATKQTFFTPKPSTSKRPPLPPKTSTASAVQKLGKFKIGAPALGPLTQEEERRKEKWRKQALGVNMGRRRVEELVDVETEEADKVEENEDENEDERPVKGKGKASVGKSNGKGKGKGKAQEPKYTPLELQYLEIKKANPDILLLIEVGYKYKFLGTDALHATKILSIACFPSHSFPTAMIPTHRLNFHVRRLVLAGHKVGIVRQVDTAALKKATGKSGTFRRELREVYTAATWVEDLGSSATSEGLEGGQVHSWVLAVVEDDVGQNGNVEIGLVALCPQSGTVLWEEFGDGGVRGELETRLGHLECVGGEVVLGLDGEVGVETERAIGRWALDGGKGPRIERAKKKRDAKEDFGFVTEFWGRKMKDGEEVLNVDRDEEMGENVILKEVVDLPGRVIEREAVRELVDGKGEWRIGKLGNLCREVGCDLEKGLVRVQYGKCTPQELLRVLLALRRISLAFDLTTDAAPGLGFKSPLLQKVCGSFSGINKQVEGWLGMLKEGAAREGKVEDLWKDEGERAPDVEECKDCVAAVNFEVDEHLKECKKLLGRPNLQFVSVAQEELLLEVPINQQKKVPVDWLKINGTRAVYRYRTPRAQQLLEERAQNKERLAATAATAFTAFLAEITQSIDPLIHVVRQVAILDCLLSLANVALQPGYCKPEFVGYPHVDIRKGRHPVVENLMEDPFVCNDVLMERDGLRTMILTGNNMGGKSSASRMIALIVIMAQIGSYVPAESAKLGIFDAVLTRMGAADELARGRSTFMVELSETSDILRVATDRSLVIMDELGRGTSTHDGVAIAQAVLHHLVTQIGCFCVFITHYPQLNETANTHPKAVQSFHMSFLEAERLDGFHDVTFLYKIVPGAATRSHGLNVAKMAGLPETILRSARAKAEEMEGEASKRAEDQASPSPAVVKNLISTDCDKGTVLNQAKAIKYAAE